MLGFANVFYTQWNVTTRTEYGRGQVVNGQFTGEVYKVTDYFYECNLSMDLDAARAKIAARAGDRPFGEDFSLRGSKSWCHRELMVESFADYQFTFGQLVSTDIREATDVWQLKRAVQQELGKRRRVIARRRLVELGELVRFVHEDKIVAKWDEETGDPLEYKSETNNWATPKQAAFLKARAEEAKMSGHFFTQGERITIEVKFVGEFFFESHFGRTYVEKYETRDGKLVKYMGASPLDIKAEDGFVTVKGTVDHSEYKGTKETKLKRMQLVKAK